jgi:hypothetical protein
MARLAGRPTGEQVSQLAGPVTQAPSAGAEGIDKGSVLGPEIEFGSFVGGVDKERETAPRKARRPDFIFQGTPRSSRINAALFANDQRSAPTGVSPTGVAQKPELGDHLVHVSQTGRPGSLSSLHVSRRLRQQQSVRYRRKRGMRVPGPAERCPNVYFGRYVLGVRVRGSPG